MTSRWMSAGLVLAALAITGCGTDPAQSVTVMISGAPSDDAERERIKDALKSLMDSGPSKSTSSMSNSAERTLQMTLFPVRDVEAFAKRIDFGTVTRIDGRTVHVTIP